MFLTSRASIPDVRSSPKLPPQQQLLLFDSLVSLPTQLPPHLTQHNSQPDEHPGSHSKQGQQPQQQPKQQAIEAIAEFLRSQLGLTLFGFDVVVSQQQSSSSSKNCRSGVNAASEDGCAAAAGAAAPSAACSDELDGSQELVVIDVNYFPNYRGGSNTPSMFRSALRQCWQQHVAEQQTKTCW